MFPKEKRLARDSFRVVASAKGRATTPHFSFSASAEAKGYAVIVSKKIAKSSVARHKLKRQVLSLLAALPLPSSLIVYARSGAPTLSPAALAEEVRAGIAKIA